MPRERLDLLLVKKGLAPSRAVAQALVMEGRVSVEGRRLDKPGSLVAPDASLDVAGPARPYASRGGFKIAAALDAFGIDVAGATVLDIGAGTGGFTDCLLQRGATRVHAFDVGHGQIEDRLRRDSRVVVKERLNARFLEPQDVGEEAALVVMDVSFISCTLILPRLAALPGVRDLIVLVKPQFEVGRGEVGRGGIVRDRDGWRRALAKVLEGAARSGWEARALIPSPILGMEGNREFLLHLTPRPQTPEAAALPAPDPGVLIEAAVASGPPPGEGETA